MPGNTLIIGHRGSSHDAPENTLASFRFAFAQGADGIEADFRLTRDGKIICLHDAGTRRTAGIDIKVADASLQELRRLDVGAWKGERWQGELIPMLEEVLEAIPPGRKLLIELKSGPEIVAPLRKILEQKVRDTTSIKILSFNEKVVSESRRLLPQYKSIYLQDIRRSAIPGEWHPEFEHTLRILHETGADGLASRAKKCVDSSYVQALHSSGRELHVWTVDSPATAKRFLDLGVDSIMTNRPGWLREKLKLQKIHGVNITC